MFKILILQVLVFSQVTCQNSDSEDGNGFYQSFSGILVSELGDKTFFIAMIMAMKFSKLFTFVGAFSALTLQTILACAVGFAFVQFVPPIYIHYASMALFFFFGIKLLVEGIRTKDNKAIEEEFEEVQKDIKNLEKSGTNNKKQTIELHEKQKLEIPLNDQQDLEQIRKTSISNNANQNQDNLIENNDIIEKIENVETQDINKDVSLQDRLSQKSDQPYDLEKKQTLEIPKLTNYAMALSTFNMTFLGEMGDRSQVTTIVLAANHSPFLVALGGLLGHLICTLVAILGGFLIKDKLSAKCINILGGLIFLAFGTIMIFEK